MQEHQILGLGAAVFGLLILFAMIRDWDWIFRMRRMDFMVRMLTRKGVRILYALIAVFMILFGLLAAMGIIEPPKKSTATLIPAGPTSSWIRV